MTTHTSGAADLPEALHRVIDDFERRERGIPQAHIAAALVTELRATLTARAISVEPARAVSETVNFTDQSTVSPIEKARRYLTHVANKKPNNPYFFDDGYPRESVADDAAAALSVLEQLAASHGQAPAQPSPMAQAAESVPAVDERDDFEKVFPLPSGCIRVGTGYASTGYSNWAAHTHCERWQGWQARAARAPADSVLEDAARWQMVVLVGNEVMLHPEKRSYAAAVAAYMDAVHRGLDLTGAIDSARKQGGA